MPNTLNIFASLLERVPKLTKYFQIIFDRLFWGCLIFSTQKDIFTSPLEGDAQSTKYFRILFVSLWEDVWGFTVYIPILFSGLWWGCSIYILKDIFYTQFQLRDFSTRRRCSHASRMSSGRLSSATVGLPPHWHTCNGRSTTCRKCAVFSHSRLVYLVPFITNWASVPSDSAAWLCKVSTGRGFSKLDRREMVFQSVSLTKIKRGATFFPHPSSNIPRRSIAIHTVVRLRWGDL
jgi:hypothetical protein